MPATPSQVKPVNHNMGLSRQHFPLRNFSCFKQIFYYVLLITCQFSSANSLPENNHRYSDPHSAKRCRPDVNSKDTIVTNPKETYHIGENITYECNEEHQSLMSEYIVYPESHRTCKLDPKTGEPVWNSPPPICAGINENTYMEAKAGVCERITTPRQDLVADFVLVGKPHSRSLVRFYGRLDSDGDIMRVTQRILYILERPTFISSVITSLLYPDFMKFAKFEVKVPPGAVLSLSPQSVNFSAQHFDSFFAHQKPLLNVSLDNAFVVKELNVYTDRVLVDFVAMARGKFGSDTMTISFLGIDQYAYNANACSSKTNSSLATSEAADNSDDEHHVAAVPVGSDAKDVGSPVNSVTPSIKNDANATRGTYKSAAAKENMIFYLLLAFIVFLIVACPFVTRYIVHQMRRKTARRADAAEVNAELINSS